MHNRWPKVVVRSSSGGAVGSCWHCSTNSICWLSGSVLRVAPLRPSLACRRYRYQSHMHKLSLNRMYATTHTMTYDKTCEKRLVGLKLHNQDHQVTFGATFFIACLKVASWWTCVSGIFWPTWVINSWAASK